MQVWGRVGRKTGNRPFPHGADIPVGEADMKELHTHTGYVCGTYVQ